MMVQNILDDKQSHLQKINALFNQLGSESTGAITYEMFLAFFVCRNEKSHRKRFCRKPGRTTLLEVD